MSDRGNVYTFTCRLTDRTRLRLGDANNAFATDLMPFFSHKPGQSSTSSSGYGHDPRSDPSLSQVQRRPLSKTPSPQRIPSLPTVMEERSEDASSMSRRSFSTQSTVIDDRDSVDVAEAVRSYQLSYGQAAPSLPTIDSGEPLTWDTARPPTDDPFTTPTRPRTYFPSHDYERPQSTSSFHSAWSLPSRPDSAHFGIPGSPSKGSYTHLHQPPSGIRLLSGNSPVDHFKFDTEGYASGALPRSLYRSPRSRSPTPAVDDDDYRISSDGTVHYTGESRTTGYTYDDTMSTRQPQYTEVDEGDEEEYDEESDEDIKDGTDEETEEGREEEDDDEYMTGDGTSEKHSSIPKPKKWVNYSGLPGDSTPIDTAESANPTTQHFGPAPMGRIHRRHKKRRVQLTNGNLVMDLPVPPKLILPLRKSDRETGFTRYTAVTCDPDDFEKCGLFLRQNESNRPTELFICVTMYNVRSHPPRIRDLLIRFQLIGG